MARTNGDGIIVVGGTAGSMERESLSQSFYRHIRVLQKLRGGNFKAS